VKEFVDEFGIGVERVETGDGSASAFTSIPQRAALTPVRADVKPAQFGGLSGATDGLALGYAEALPDIRRDRRDVNPDDHP
jgi:hypothetical protein